MVAPKSFRAQLLLVLVGLLQEVVLRVQLVAATRVEPAPAELVGAAARDDVDLRAARAAELGPVAVAQDLELLDRVERRVHEDRAVRPDVVVVGAVHRPQVRRDIAAAHRQVGSAEQPLVLHVEGVGRAHAGHERRELEEVAAVERQLARLSAGDDARQVATKDLHRGRGGFDGDHLAHFARLEREVDRVVVGDAERDARPGGRLEARQLRLHVVASDGQVADRVDAVGVGDRDPDQPRVEVGDRHGRAGNDRFRRVGGRAPDRRARALGKGRRTCGEHETHANGQSNYSHADSTLPDELFSETRLITSCASGELYV